MKYLLVISFIVAALNVVAQRPLVQLEVTPKEAEIGQSVTITVKANVQGDLEVDLPKSFQSGNATMSSMQQEIDYNSGKIVTYFIHSQNGSFNKSGSFTIGPAYIKRGNKVFKSNSTEITVKQEVPQNKSEQRFSVRQLTQPAFGIIQIGKKTYYEGEPIVLNAKIYSRFAPTHLEGYEAYSSSGSVEKHDLNDGSEEIALKEERVGRTSFYSFIYDKQLIFPLISGKLEIKPYEMILMRGFESFQLTSNSTSLDIKPLPDGAPKEFTGGVGKFQIRQNTSDKTIQTDEMITVKRTVTGVGNLHLITFPEFKAPNGFELYGDPEIKENFNFGSEGAKGSISYTYHLKASKPGNLVIPAFELAYFDPDKAAYVRLRNEEDKISVTGDPTISQTDSKDQNENESFHKASAEPTDHQSNNYLPILILALITSALAIFSIKLLREKRRYTDSATLTAPAVFLKEQEPITDQVVRRDHIKEAEQRLVEGDVSGFFNLLERGMIDHLKIFTGSNESGRNQLLSLISHDSSIEDLNSWFKDFDALRYGMGINNTDPQALLERARSLQKKLVK